jgi:hypothetical protein
MVRNLGAFVDGVATQTELVKRWDGAEGTSRAWDDLRKVCKRTRDMQARISLVLTMSRIPSSGTPMETASCTFMAKGSRNAARPSNSRFRN